MTVLHLFPNLMNLYGDYANRVVLARFLRSAGAGVGEVLDDRAGADFGQAACLLIGPGTERALERAEALIRPRTDDLAAAIQAGLPVLLTGNACELPVRLGLVPFSLQPLPERVTGDVLADAPRFGRPVIGYYNHMAAMTGIGEPLFRCRLGPLKAEGYADRGLLGTYLTGPLLVRNPHVLRDFGRLALARAGEGTGAGAEAPEAEAAYQDALRGLSSRIG